jgi:hypothetical protein
MSFLLQIIRLRELVVVVQSHLRIAARVGAAAKARGDPQCPMAVLEPAVLWKLSLKFAVICRSEGTSNQFTILFWSISG